MQQIIDALKILLLDNYDSFTFNLAHIIEQVDGTSLTVMRNDKLTVDEVGAYDKIILSPGPGLPEDAGICCDVIREYHKTKSIMGICLGMQAIGIVFGSKLSNLGRVMHGIEDKTHISDPSHYIFKGIYNPFISGRYHSWGILRNDIGAELKETAYSDNWVMALRHQSYDVCGVQFHPESVMTKQGKEMLFNWVKE